MDKKYMAAISIARYENGAVLETPDEGMGAQSVYIPFEQIPIIIRWLTETLEDYEEETGESDNG